MKLRICALGLVGFHSRTLGSHRTVITAMSLRRKGKDNKRIQRKGNERRQHRGRVSRYEMVKANDGRHKPTGIKYDDVSSERFGIRFRRSLLEEAGGNAAEEAGTTSVVGVQAMRTYKSHKPQQRGNAKGEVDKRVEPSCVRVGKQEDDGSQDEHNEGGQILNNAVKGCRSRHRFHILPQYRQIQMPQTHHR